MILATDFSIPKEIAITEEASKKLIEVILEIQNGLIKSWSSLPPHLQVLFKFAKIKLNLQEEEHDQVVIDIRIAQTFETKYTTTKFKELGYLFKIPCLVPHIEKTTDDAFKKIAHILINQIKANLRDVQQCLEEVETPQ